MPALLNVSILLGALVGVSAKMACLAAELSEHSLTVGEQKRHFTLVKPASYRAGHPAVVLLHGGSLSMRRVLDEQNSSSHWRTVAEREGFLLLVPNGFNTWRRDPAGDKQSWNDIRARNASGGVSQLDDVAFMIALVDWADKTHAIDRKRVYATGSSNGGMMAMRLLIDAPEHFAAGAAFIGAMPKEAVAKPAVARPIMIMNGDADPLVLWEGGPVAKRGSPTRSVDDSVAWWLQTHGLDPQLAEKDTLPDADPADGCRIIRTSYPAEPQGPARVLFYRVTGGGHCMPDPDPPQRTRLVTHVLGTQARDAHGVELAWQFLQQHTIATDE